MGGSPVVQRGRLRLLVVGSVLGWVSVGCLVRRERPCLVAIGVHEEADVAVDGERSNEHTQQVSKDVETDRVVGQVGSEIRRSMEPATTVGEWARDRRHPI